MNSLWIICHQLITQHIETHDIIKYYNSSKKWLNLYFFQFINHHFSSSFAFIFYFSFKFFFSAFSIIFFNLSFYNLFYFAKVSSYFSYFLHIESYFFSSYEISLELNYFFFPTPFYNCYLLKKLANDLNFFLGISNFCIVFSLSSFILFASSIYDFFVVSSIYLNFSHASPIFYLMFDPGLEE